MSVKIRLARWGARKRPYYHIVAADSRSPRDGKFLETIGKYNPLLSDGDKKYIIKEDRLQYWLSNGAIPTDKVHKILSINGFIEPKKSSQQTKKHLPKAKAQARLDQLKAQKDESSAETSEA